MQSVVENRLASVAREHGKVVALAAALERIIFAERKGREFLWQKDTAQIRVTGKLDPEHVEQFPLHPVRPFPQGHDRRDGELGLVQKNADRQSLVRIGPRQQIRQAETVDRAAVVQVIDARNVDKIIELPLLLEESKRRVEDVPRQYDARASAKLPRAGLRKRFGYGFDGGRIGHDCSTALKSIFTVISE